MANISTLSQDIMALLDNREGTDLVVDEWAKYATNMAQHIHTAISEDTRGPRSDSVLWASEIGKPCLRQVWYKINKPDVAEKLMPHTRFKFLYGSLLEETALTLAKAAGHTVTDEQMKIELDLSNGWKVSGRIDAVIDGTIVDVKSMSPYGFAEFKEKGYEADNDKFGYRAQVDYYRWESQLYSDHPGHILGIDKVNGHIVNRPVNQFSDRTAMHSYLVHRTDELSYSTPPSRSFNDEATGVKGNRKLCTECSYCEFKKECWPDVRTFIYSNGPVFLTVVKDTPKVPEVK